ncbi:hypothetical protein PR048_029426 [Dryococelus australis]|uniref:Reverse transcriptase domain-containing protein n=1 Tax=Dryococelus australis TaxID=614101 RepID=A0ABQ9GDB9_9NEOP|nr:hypothetical protein PR048_029426 [Dryococelus australis]
MKSKMVAGKKMADSTVAGNKLEAVRSRNVQCKGRNLQLSRTNIVLQAHNGSQIRVFGPVLLEIRLRNMWIRSDDMTGVHNSAGFWMFSKSIQINFKARFGSGIKTIEQGPPCDIISKVDKPTKWVNLLVIVEKAEGSLCVSLDPQALNKAINKQYYEIPTINDLKGKKGKAKVFSVLNLKESFWQIRLMEDGRKYCTFSTVYGCYCFNVLPFGSEISAEAFQEICEAHFDDIYGLFIYTDEYYRILDKELLRARELNIKFNVRKFQYFPEIVKYFGHEIIEEWEAGIHGKENTKHVLKSTNSSELGPKFTNSHTDSSNCVIGSVLLQEGHSVMFASKSLSKSEGSQTYRADAVGRATFTEVTSNFDGSLNEAVGTINVSDVKHSDPTLQRLVLHQNGWPTRKSKIPDHFKFDYNLRNEIGIANGLVLGYRIVVPLVMRHATLQKQRPKDVLNIFFIRLIWILMFRPFLNLDCVKKHYSKKGKEQSLLDDVCNCTLEEIGCDFDYGGECYLIVADYYSKRFALKPVSSKTTATVIKELKTIFATHGVPEIVSVSLDDEISQSLPPAPIILGQMASMKYFQELNTLVMGSPHSAAQLFSRTTRSTLPVDGSLLTARLVSGFSDYQSHRNYVNRRNCDKTARQSRRISYKGQQVVFLKTNGDVFGVKLVSQECLRPVIVKDREGKVFSRSTYYVKPSFVKRSVNLRVRVGRSMGCVSGQSTTDSSSMATANVASGAPLRPGFAMHGRIGNRRLHSDQDLSVFPQALASNNVDCKPYLVSPPWSRLTSDQLREEWVSRSSWDHDLTVDRVLSFLFVRLNVRFERIILQCNAAPHLWHV